MPAESPRALMLDPDESAVIDCARGLTNRGWAVDYAPTFEEALGLIREFAYSLVVIELRLPDALGLDVWTYIKKLYPDTLGIITTSSPSLYASVNAFATGILSFTLKPLEANLVYNWAAYVLEHQRAVAENLELQRNLIGLGNLISSISAASSTQQILQTALAHLPAVLKPDWFLFTMLGDDHTTWSESLLHNLSAGPKDLTPPQVELLNELMNEVLETRQIALIDKSPKSEFKYGVGILRDVHLHGIMVAPIMGQEHLFGVLGVIYGPESQDVFSTAQTQELLIIGRTIGLVMDRLRLLEPIRVTDIAPKVESPS